MANNQTETCAHPSCVCPPAKDSKYCGTLCEGNAGTSDIICACGHSECAAVTITGAGECYPDGLDAETPNIPIEIAAL
jgi:hypothetical protein